MDTDFQTDEKPDIHLGRNVQRIREIMGMKQSTLAANTGYSQQYISKLEQSDKFADDILNKVAEGLGVAPDLIRNFDEEKTVYNIQNNYESSNNNGPNYRCTINPIDKLIEMIDENKRLYDALLKAEREKNALLEQQIQHLKKA
jgi:transcriptional regulator with XRE-family HTH domain